MPTAAPSPVGSRRDRAAEESPPAMVLVTGITAGVLVLPGLLAGLLAGVWFPIVSLGTLLAPSVDGLRIASSAALVAVVPVLQLVGLVRFARRTGRWLLVAALLPSSAFVVWGVVSVLANGDSSAWPVLGLLVPAAAPLFGLAPSVGRWMAPGARSPGPT
jgi:hypothetical protein